MCFVFSKSYVTDERIAHGQMFQGKMKSFHLIYIVIDYFQQIAQFSKASTASVSSCVPPSSIPTYTVSNLESCKCYQFFPLNSPSPHFHRHLRRSFSPSLVLYCYFQFKRLGKAAENLNFFSWTTWK